MNNQEKKAAIAEMNSARIDYRLMRTYLGQLNRVIAPLKKLEWHSISFNESQKLRAARGRRVKTFGTMNRARARLIGAVRVVEAFTLNKVPSPSAPGHMHTYERLTDLMSFPEINVPQHGYSSSFGIKQQVTTD